MGTIHCAFEVAKGLQSGQFTNGVHVLRTVGIAFHSRWMDPAKVPFESFMRSIRSGAGVLPMVCCERAALLSELPDDYFWAVVRNPMHFARAISESELRGVCRYIDVGPAGTLATFLKYVLPASSKSTAHLVLNPFGHEQENLAALSGAMRRPAAREQVDS